MVSGGPGIEPFPSDFCTYVVFEHVASFGARGQFQADEIQSKYLLAAAIMRSLGVIRRVDTAFKRPSTLQNCNRSWLYAAPGLRLVGESQETSKA